MYDNFKCHKILLIFNYSLVECAYFNYLRKFMCINRKPVNDFLCFYFAIQHK